MNDIAALIQRSSRVVETRPVLGVVGDFDHFRQAVLGKVAERYFEAIELDPRTPPARPRDAVIRWVRHEDLAVDAALRADGVRILNDAPLSVHKEVVQEHFAAVFGYDLGVDPSRHQGPAVVKSNENALHDGRVMLLPAAVPERGMVYQRLIDNSAGEVNGTELICDYRLPVVSGHIPFAYLKFRPLASRFSNANLFAKLVAVSDVIAPDEAAKCLAFCAAMGLDYGELDVLRDRQDGRIYIVDANNRPFGPPNGIHPFEEDVALRLIGEAWLGRVFGANP